MNVRVDPSTLAGIGDTNARVLASLRTSIGADQATSWFGLLNVESIEGRRAVVSQPTNFLRTWVRDRYSEALKRAVRSIEPTVDVVEIVVRSSSRKAPSPAPAATAPQQPELAAPAPIVPRPEAVLPSSPLDRRLTFATLQVGRCNQLAHAAALGIAQRTVDGPLLYSPFFLHGAVGLGKTHLLQAIAHEAAGSGRRVAYLTAEKFMYGFVLAMKAQTTHAFKQRLRDVDILLIDDAQFLQGKSVQQEFCQTINAMVSGDRQVVIAADRPPHDLENLDDRLRSRIAAGLCVEIGVHDRDVRLAILSGLVEQTKAHAPSFDVSGRVLERVADLIQTNGRGLAGAVNRLLAHACLTQAALTVEAAEIAIRDLVHQREPKRIKIEDIQKLVATHYNVSRPDILSSRRTANVVRPRQIAMYLAKTLTLRSLPEIGRRFGGRDHTTVLHAVRKIEGLSGSDAALAEELRVLRAMLED